MCHWVGVSRTTEPFRRAWRAAKSMVKSGVVTTAWPSGSTARRTAARSRANSSSMPKGLVR